MAGCDYTMRYVAVLFCLQVGKPFCRVKLKVIIMAGNIAIVDDFPLTLQFIEHHLQQAGYCNLFTFGNPLDLISYMQDGNRPQIIITDYQMPGLNGIELLNRIRNTFGSFPSIITTADCISLEPALNQYPVLQKGTPCFIPELLALIKKLTPSCHSITCFS